MSRGNSLDDKSKMERNIGVDKSIKEKENQEIMRNRYNKNTDKWDHLRESKLERMRAHKANVERRMRTSDNLDSRMYWSQRNDKLKRYTRNESLDPSWYTDNIYSNYSIDLDEEDEDEEENFYATNEKFERLFARNNDYNYEGPHSNTIFEHKRGHVAHLDAEYNYPKSRSCCFGGGYNERAKPQLMPKSSSFTVAGRTTYGFRTSREPPRHFDPLDYAVNNSTDTTNGYRKLYCWQNTERDCDKYGEAKEIYHIDRDRDIYKKSKNDIMMQTQHSTNANCIRNIWCRRENYKNNILNEINGNYQDDYEYGMDEKYRTNDTRKRLSFDSHFVEEYLIMHDPAPSPSDPIHVNDHLDYFSNTKERNSMDQLFEDDVKLLNNPIDNEDEDHSNMLCGLSMTSKQNRGRTKSLLEVKPPNRFDDTESDSTELDLDDFSFDFEKYWSELDKSTSIIIDNRYDLDYRNNNVTSNATGHNTIKNKNINVEKYNNGQCRRDINFNERTNDDDSAHFMHDYNKQNILDLLPSPTHTARTRYPVHKSNDNHNFNHEYNRSSDRQYQRSRLNDNPLSDLSKLSPIEDDLPSHDLYIETDQIDHGAINNNRKSTIKSRNGHGNPALSLINNIFSIYKPKKYAQENCRSRTKPETMTKSMNVSSTVRPLGAPYNDFMTSIKRPLTITPPRYNATRTFSASIDQPHFKIIPEKTGLKISPLYRFGYGIDESKLRLKCTARPLLFPL